MQIRTGIRMNGAVMEVEKRGKVTVQYFLYYRSGISSRMRVNRTACSVGGFLC